ncbi:MAG: PAS domain S-box protein [Deltaproteobacteria bacterium]|nr:PAS domain S-box protein [Deltaproteobacteria bacterium]MBW2122124.1 PAS domain S-box protein [Deltaproteobacteria bacterium]
MARQGVEKGQSNSVVSNKGRSKRLSRVDKLLQEIERLRNFNESIIQSISSGLILVDNGGKISYINKATEKILAYTPEEVIGKDFEILHLREKKNLMGTPFDPSGDIDTRREGSIRRKDGVDIPTGFTISNHVDVHGSKIGEIVIFRDLTDVYKMQEEILRMDRLVSLGEISSGIAHEIRNPLAGIKTTAQAMGEDMDRNDPKREYLNRITKEIDRLNDLLKMFFSFAKPQKPNLVFCNIKDVVTEITPLLIKDIADRGITFVEKYHPELPRVKVDLNQMHQVFLNLFLNAIQAMPKGGELRIEADPLYSKSSSPSRADYVQVAVRDTGQGVPPNILSKIFDPFFTTKAKGVGLGLSISYQIIKKHGGTIRVESKAGSGTAFFITLPLFNGGIEG